MTREQTRAWRKLAAAQRARGLACWLCGQPIDYSLQWPHPDSFSADHDKPYIRHPELRLDPGNVRSSHLKCNQAKGDTEHFTTGLGSLSEDF